MGSRERLWARYGDAWGWPPATMTYEARETFNFVVLDDEESELLGCALDDALSGWFRATWGFEHYVLDPPEA